MGQLVLGQLSDGAPVAQDDDPVAAGLHFAQAMGDVDRRHAVALKVVDHLEQAVRLGQREAGGRLVHDDDARVERERFGDLHHLPLRDRQVLDHVGRFEIDAEPRQERPDAGMHRLLVDELEQAAEAGLPSDEHVRRHVQVLEQVELLMHEGDASRRRLRSR